MKEATTPVRPSNFVALIPARRGSKGLPGKNVRTLAGKPLYWHSIQQALLAGATKVIISTDIEQILESEHPEQVQIIRRPDTLAADDVTMEPVITHALSTACVSGAVVLLQPTSPLRRPVHILSALEMFDTHQFSLVMSVNDTDSRVLKYGLIENGLFYPVADKSFLFANRQNLPQVYRPNGSIYVFDAHHFIQTGRLNPDKIGAFPMAMNFSFDIDNLDDFRNCERLFTEECERETNENW